MVFSPPEMFEKLVLYANQHGRPDGKPYFSANGKQPLTGKEWGNFALNLTAHMGLQMSGSDQLYVMTNELNLLMVKQFT